jgi:hypothetical protein
MTLKLERRDNKSPMALDWCIEGGMHWYVHDVLPSSLLIMAYVFDRQERIVRVKVQWLTQRLKWHLYNQVAMGGVWQVRTP